MPREVEDRDGLGGAFQPACKADVELSRLLPTNDDYMDIGESKGKLTR